LFVYECYTWFDRTFTNTPFLLMWFSSLLH